jgi:hypothetical protein
MPKKNTKWTPIEFVIPSIGIKSEQSNSDVPTKEIKTPQITVSSGLVNPKFSWAEIASGKSSHFDFLYKKQ